jgi:thiamine monophosphate kinase
VLDAARDTGTRCTVIGECTAEPGLRLWRGGEPADVAIRGFDHFAQRC